MVLGFFCFSYTIQHSMHGSERLLGAWNNYTSFPPEIAFSLAGFRDLDEVSPFLCVVAEVIDGR